MTFRPHYRRIELVAGKMMKKNEKLKTLLAEKELGSVLLSETIKKDGEEK